MRIPLFMHRVANDINNKFFQHSIRVSEPFNVVFFIFLEKKFLGIEFSQTNPNNIFVTFIPERDQTEIKLTKPVAFEQAIQIYAGLEHEDKNRIAQENFRQHSNANPKQ